MTEQLKQSLPAVWKVLKDAESLINEITGTKVKVSVEVTEQHKYHQHLIDVICRYFGISFIELAGPSRATELVAARQIFILLAYKPKTPGCMSDELGRLLNRDHSTILYSLAKIKKLIDVQDEYICTAIENIEDELLTYEIH